MKRKLVCLLLVALMVASLSVPALAASYSFSKTLSSGKSGYLSGSDVSGGSGSSWYVFYPSSKVSVNITSNSGGEAVVVNFASSGGDFLKSVEVNVTGTASCSYSSGCVVQFDNISTSKTTLKGTVTTS